MKADLNWITIVDVIKYMCTELQREYKSRVQIALNPVNFMRVQSTCNKCWTDRGNDYAIGSIFSYMFKCIFDTLMFDGR